VSVTQIFAARELLVELDVQARAAPPGGALFSARRCGRPVKTPSIRLNVGKPDLVRGRFLLPAARALRHAGGIESRLRMALFEVLEDQRRVVDDDVAVDQHRHLALGVERHHVRMMGLIAVLEAPADLDPLVGESLLVEGHADLRGEEAEGAGIQLHGSSSAGARRDG
jgi:hypothetical protein